MLEELNIKNAALIKSAEIEFDKGLNVLSGETGAGKSMVIGSLTFVLGERASREFIRDGEDKAVVEAVFGSVSDAARQCAEGMGIDCSDGMLILQRTINRDGKTAGRINGVSVTASMLKNLSSKLVDIHSQHESHSLLNASKHIDILDRFCAPQINEKKRKLSELTERYRGVVSKLKSVSGDDDERQRRISLLEFRIDEIDKAGLKAGEEEELARRKKVLMASEKLIRQSRQCLELLYYGTGEVPSAADKTGDALKICGLMAASDQSISQVYENIDLAYSKLQEASEAIKDYLESISSDPDEINRLEERLDIIYSLKKKYGATIEEIIDSRNKAASELEFLNNSREIREKLSAEKEKLLKSIRSICSDMTGIRKSAAVSLQQEITSQLRDLEMKNAVFEICISQKDTFNQKGWDNVEFMISTNAGEGLKPLSKTASGGEMSRVMLGLKTVIAGNESIDTFVFDEIDTGISGKTASKVAEKMAFVSQGQQILCITHLPQIASMADKNLLITKIAENGKTVTQVGELDKNRRIHEVLRLMGSNETETAIKAAKEMIEYSDMKKNNIRKK
ncbi:DNA repair protein RecN [Lachnospiraceae bacterium NSJ-143]|nr:DNA repair protein RecN [Lachnospiraceae bacterium NSJ-143]